MNLDQAYHQIETRLDKLDFSALFRGFSRFPFALYDNTRAYIGGAYLDRPAEFLGNTSVLFRGAHTAIWNLTKEPEDLDVLTSKLVHEMLHAFQHTMGETRWADERQALVKYRYDPENISARLKEAACMRACLSGADPAAFARLLALRRARMERSPFAYDYESRIEQIEGSAHFVELAALAQLDENKAKRRWEQLFAALEDPAQYFPVRAVTYLSGAAFIACLRRYTDLDTDSFTDIPFAAAALASARPCALPESDPRAAACLADWQKQCRTKVDRALEKDDVVLDGTYRLIVWNVYDAVWDGRYAVLTAFIGYLEGTEMPDTDEDLFARMQVLQGDFIAEMDESLRLFRVWRQ